MKNKNSVLLTIAVPVYNVEKYLNRCLESLVSQEIKDFEILLVDDGSEDGGPEICDEYQKKYSFIRVIHQPNKGLATVRNICIEEARGEYISFIDSDDYVLKGTYSHLLKILDETKADILNFGYINLYEDSRTKYDLKVNSCSEQILSFTAQEAIDEMLLPKHIDVITCNKIIRKKLYRDVVYPEGKLYEDMFTNYKVLAKAKKIVSTNYKFYVYCHRSSSIGGMKFNPKTMDLAKAAKEVYDFGCDFCVVKKNLDVGYLYWLVVVANIMIKSKADEMVYIKETQRFARKNTFKIISNNCLNFTRKIELLLFGYSYRVYKFFYKCYVEKKR